MAHSFLRLEKIHQAVLHLLLGPEHCFLVIQQKRLKTSILNPDIVAEPAVVQYIPLEGRAERCCPAFPHENVTKIEGARVTGEEAEGAGQRERWIELCLGNADESTLRRSLELGAANIRPPPQQLRRNANRNLERGSRDFTGAAQKIMQLPRRHAQQNAERV